MRFVNLLFIVFVALGTSAQGDAPDVLLRVNLQGRGTAPTEAWQTAVTVLLTESCGGPLQYIYELNTDSTGRVVLKSLPAGIYDLRIRTRTSLINVRHNVLLGTQTRELHMGTLFEGDANHDGVIDGADFDVIKTHYGTKEDEAGYERQADLNDDGIVNVLDFSLLSANFGLAGPRETAGCPFMLARSGTRVGAVR